MYGPLEYMERDMAVLWPLTVEAGHPAVFSTQSIDHSNKRKEIVGIRWHSMKLTWANPVYSERRYNVVDN